MAGNWGFIGPTYQGLSRAVTSDRSINLYPEILGSRGPSESKLNFYGRPGKSLFATLPEPCRALSDAGGNSTIPRMFAIGGANLYEVFADGTINLDAVLEDGPDNPKIIATNDDLLIYDGNGNIWWRHGGSTIKVLTDVRDLAYSDGYALALRANTGDFNYGKQINISQPNQFATWEVLDFKVKQTSPDVIVALTADHGLVHLHGKKTTEVWTNTGAEFPFERYNPGFIEQGLWAKSSVAKLGESIYWLGGDERGVGQVFRSTGHTPKRVSNHAVEAAIRSYALANLDTSDAVGFGYQEVGHPFYVLHFPTANATWVYDEITDMWHERGYWDGATLHQDFGRFHTWQFGKHFVGDYRNGKIYQASVDLFDDDGEPILWERTAPHVSNDKKRVRYNSFWLDKEIGTTLETVTLFTSRNGGKNFGAGRTATVQEVSGQPDGRAKWNQLGSGRDLVLKVRTTAAVRQAWTDGFIEIDGGLGT